MCHTVNSTAY